MSFACLVTRKRPSSEKWVWMASSSTCFTSPARTVLAALRARSMKSVLCAAMPMLWNFWSEKSGLTVEKAWQSLQRPLPLNRPQPCFAAAPIAFSSPATKRSKGASPAYCVRSKAAIAAAMSS